MSAPLVSICIPTYNRVKLLERTLRSALAQTYANLEIIISDNSDNFISRDLVSSFNDARIRYFKNETNIGFINNIDKVMSLATGKFINVLMDDDLLKPQAIEKMVEAFEKNPSVGVVWAPMELIDDNDRRIFPYFYVFRKMRYRFRFQVGDGLISGGKILEEFLTHDYPCCVPSGLLYRVECFQKLGFLDLKSEFAIDVELCMRIAAHYDFYYIDEVLSSFRVTTVSETTNLHKKGFNAGVFYYITRKFLADEKAMGLFTAARRKSLIRDSIFFCSCRAMLNGLAGLRARSLKMIIETLRLIFQEDKFLLNKIRLPIFAIKEIWISIFPLKVPPARE